MNIFYQSNVNLFKSQNIIIQLSIKYIMFENALKQLDAIFPEFTIKQPIKKAVVRSLIQQIQIPSFSTNNLSLLKNPETAKKVLQKLSTIFSKWLKILQTNEKARQQHQSKFISNKGIQKLQYTYAQCAQIQSKSDFALFIKKNGKQMFEETASGPNINEYKQILIYNSLDSYNTITLINQDQYFQQLQELTQKLSILERMTKAATKNINNLQQFYDLMKSQELFKKKDNELNRIINYNIVRTLELSKDLQKNRKKIYKLQQNFVFSLARNYYICFMAEDDIEKSKNHDGKLKQIKSFICERQQKVFPKLYNRKVNKYIVKLDVIERQFMNRKFEEQDLIQKEKKLENVYSQLHQVKHKINGIKQPISQKQFIIIFNEVSNILSNSNKLNDPKVKQIRQQLLQTEQLLVSEFVKGDGNGQQKRRFLSKENINYTPIDVNQNEQVQSADEEENIEEQPDLGDDIFPPLENINYEEQKVANAIKRLQENPNIYENQCKNYIKLLKQENADSFDDEKNFEFSKIQLLLKVGEKLAKANNQSTIPEYQILEQLAKSWTKPQIRSYLLQKMFNPKLRPQAYKIFLQKLLEHNYKISKSINSPQFQKLPQNIQNYLTKRQKLVKITLKKIEKFQQIMKVLSKLKTKTKYNVCSKRTLNSFLKLVLVKKEISAYQNQIQLQRNIEKHIKQFINVQIYSSILNAVIKKTTEIFGQNVQLFSILDEIEEYSEFLHETNRIIDKFLISFETEKQARDIIREQLSRILKKWHENIRKRLQNKNTIFEYNKPQEQLERLRQIIALCEEGRKAEGITDKKAKKFLRMIL